MSAFRTTDTHVYFLGDILSQWYRSPFKGSLPYPMIINRRLSKRFFELEFITAEQFMMASKASIFRDLESASLIMNTSSPKEQKALGRKVKSFDADTWNQIARDIVMIGNYYKFTQNEECMRFLLDTGDRILVEGASYDRIWGVGIDWSSPAIEDSRNWKGTNWLGQCLMRVRNVIRNHGVNADPYDLI